MVIDKICRLPNHLLLHLGTNILLLHISYNEKVNWIPISHASKLEFGNESFPTWGNVSVPKNLLVNVLWKFQVSFRVSKMKMFFFLFLKAADMKDNSKKTQSDAKRMSLLWNYISWYKNVIEVLFPSKQYWTFSWQSLLASESRNPFLPGSW